MQLTTNVRNNALPGLRTGRGRLPAMLVLGTLFMFVLAACQVAVADDGSINIKPEATTANGNTATGNNGLLGAGNTLAGFPQQTGEVDPTTVSPIDPNQVYAWNGVIEFIRTSNTAEGHFIVDRGCDRWSIIPNSDEIYGKLRELNGEKATVWGSVSFNNHLGHRAIEATSVFAPGDIRPLIALPEIPCDKPVPGTHIAVNHSEITLHGDLVWRAGRLWLATDRGNVLLDLPAVAWDMIPELAIPGTSDDQNVSISLGEYGVVGLWDLASTGLVVNVREIKEWPHRTFVRNHCGGGFHHFVVGDSQMAAHGTLVITDAEWLLRTKSGVIVIHRNVAGDDGVAIDPATGEVIALRPEILRTHDVVVIGEWKTDGNRLHMEADKFVRVKRVCEPPKPPHQPILPGEIGALGTLVFEGGRPFLNTPSGRIVLLTQNEVDGEEPVPANPSIFEDVAPEVLDAAGGAVSPDGSLADPDVVRPVRHILVVGKWMLYRDHLAIVVRYALPWPYPYAQPVDPNPAPEPQPVPPILDAPDVLLPVAAPGVIGFPFEPANAFTGSGFDGVEFSTVDGDEKPTASSTSSISVGAYAYVTPN